MADLKSGTPDVYILGGYQTDFARNWTKERKHFAAMMREGVLGALEATDVDPKDVEVAHVGNFAAELYCKQGHLGAFFVEVAPAFRSTTSVICCNKVRVLIGLTM